MSFFNPSATPVVRSRKTKDGGNRNVVIGIARRKETSKAHEDKSSTSTQLYVEESSDPTGGRKPDTVREPSSGDAATFDTRSRSEKEPSCINTPLQPNPATSQPTTPIALQQYLDEEPEEKAFEKIKNSGSTENCKTSGKNKQEMQEAGEGKLRFKAIQPFEHKNRWASTERERDRSTIEQKNGSPREWANTDSMRRYGPEALLLPDGHVSELSVPEPSLLYQLAPPYTHPLFDVPVPPHILPPDRINFQDRGGHDGFHSQNHMPTFGHGQVQPFIKPVSSGFYPPPTQMGFIHDQVPNSTRQDLSQYDSASLQDEEAELFSTLDQINWMLPKIQRLLRQKSVSPNQTTVRTAPSFMPGSWPDEMLQEKEARIIKLTNTIKDLRTELQNERSTFQNKLDEAKSAHSQLEICLNTKNKSLDGLRTSLEQLHHENTELNARSKRAEVALESFVQWLLQHTSMGHLDTNQESQSISIDERGPQENLETALSSIVSPLTPTSVTLESTSKWPQHASFSDERLLNPGRTDITSTVNEHIQLKGIHTDTKSIVQNEPDFPSLLSRGWTLSATNARVRIWEEDYAQLKRQSEEHRQYLIDCHEREKRGLEEKITSVNTHHETRCHRLEEENMFLLQEKEQLEAQLASLRADWVQSNHELKASAAHVEKEAYNLRKVVEERIGASKSPSLETKH